MKQREQRLGFGKLSLSFKYPEIWGNRFTERRKIMHNEIVLDAGCGTGRVAKIIIADTAKKGKVYAGDTDANTIANDKTSRIFKHSIHQIIFI